MKSNKRNKILLLLLVMAIGLGAYYVRTQKSNPPTNTVEEKSFYNYKLLGIPNIENQKLVQDNMEQQGSNNAIGILSYKLENTEKTVAEVTDYFIKNTDTNLWEVNKLESNDKNTQQLIYNSKDEKVKSTTQITIIKAEKNIIITLTSYYDNSKLIKESQENNKKGE